MSSVNKFDYFGNTIFDITDTTATQETVREGMIFHDATGDSKTGTLKIQHYYTGSSAPSSSLGEDGDIYLMG